MIKERHGKQETLPSIANIGSVSSNMDTSDLPPLVTITASKKIDQASFSATPPFIDVKAMDIDDQSE